MDKMRDTQYIDGSNREERVLFFILFLHMNTFSIFYYIS